MYTDFKSEVLYFMGIVYFSEEKFRICHILRSGLREINQKQDS